MDRLPLPVACGWCLRACFHDLSSLEVDAGLQALAYVGLVLVACYGVSVVFRLIIRRGISNAELLLVAVVLLVSTYLWFFLHNAIGDRVAFELLANDDPVLARAYMQDRRCIVRYMALRVLASAQDDDSHDGVRWKAITILGKFRGSLAVADSTFEVWAASEDPLVAVPASRVLLLRGHTTSIRRLAETLKALRSPREGDFEETKKERASVAKFVASCLEEVTGFAFGTDADVWIDWYEGNHEELSWDPSANRYVTGASREGLQD